MSAFIDPDAETNYRLADGLFPVRLEPGKPLLIGRDGSPLLIEIWTHEKQGLDALIVFDPSGAKPTDDAVAHALAPLAGLAGEPFDPPAQAPPSSRAFRFVERVDGPAPSARSDVAGASPRAPLRAWVDDARLEAMLWAELELAREEGKADRELIMALFDGGNRPGFGMLTAMTAKQGLSPAEAESRARKTAHDADMAGGRLVFQLLATRDALRGALDEGGILPAYGPLLDAALATWPAASDVPEGRVRAVLFEDDTVEPRLVAIRTPGERAAEARATEQDALMQALLDRVGDEVRAQHAERLNRGNAAHNLAILIEEGADGALKPWVAMRSDVARTIEAWAGARAAPIVKALGKSAPAGMTHAVFAVRRESKVVFVHRMTVVQGAGRN